MKITWRLELESKGIYKNSHIVSGYSLPNTMDIEKWGNNISYNDNRSFAKINRFKGKCIYEINILKDHNTISLKKDGARNNFFYWHLF